jgi:hypothetical protein
VSHRRNACARAETRHVRDVIGWLTSKGYDIKVSEVALGELIKVLAKKERRLPVSSSDLLSRLLDILEKEEKTVCRLDRMPLRKFTILMNRIISQGETSWAQPSDLMILAYAIADEKCKGVLTLDLNFISDSTLTRFLKDPATGRRGFVITSDPREFSSSHR